MNKKRILFLNTTLRPGGVERSLCDVLRNIDYKKYEVDLYLDSENGALMSQIPTYVRMIHPNMDETDGRFLSIVKPLLKKRAYDKIYLRMVRKLVAIFGNGAYYLLRPLYRKYGRYDVVVAYREGEVTQFAYRAFKWKKYVGWWHYGGFPDSNKEYRALKRIDSLVAVSNYSKEALMQKFDYLADRIVTIPNMVDTELISQAGNEGCPAYAKGMLHFVTVARLSPEKHLENVIYSAKHLLIQRIPFQWHLIGGGLLFEELKEEIARNNLEGKVILEGEKANPYPFIKNAYLYVHPSYVESQGLSILEAMALGVPCVVTKSRGPCEFIRDGENGLLTEQNAQSLAEQVERMMCDHELYEKIKRNTVCPAQYRVENVTEMLEKLFD